LIVVCRVSIICLIKSNKKINHSFELECEVRAILGKDSELLQTVNNKKLKQNRDYVFCKILILKVKPIKG